MAYMKFVRKRYKINWESIKWGFLVPRSLLIGPFNQGVIQGESYIQLTLNSVGPAYNIVREN